MSFLPGPKSSLGLYLLCLGHKPGLNLRVRVHNLQELKKSAKSLSPVGAFLCSI